MKLHTLGTGGPRLDSERGAACHVLEVAGRHLMFDVGRGAIRGVAATGLPIAEIGPLFISRSPAPIRRGRSPSARGSSGWC